MSRSGDGGKGLGEEYLYSRQAEARFGFKKILLETKCWVPDKKDLELE